MKRVKMYLHTNCNLSVQQLGSLKRPMKTKSNRDFHWKQRLLSLEKSLKILTAS